MNWCYKVAAVALLSGCLTLSAQVGASTPPQGTAVTGDPGAASSAISPAAPYAAAPVTPGYVLGDQDVIQVTVWHEPTLSGNLVVRPDGMVSVPLLGDVKAAGLTPMALGTDLSQRLTRYVKDPLVTVTVVAVNSNKIYLIGEVAHPGAEVLSPGMTALQAIAAAGGLTAYASEKHIYVLRGKAGRQKKIPFNYKKALKQGDQQGVNLAAGDTIVVP